jgi:hypothetical protein
VAVTVAIDVLEVRGVTLGHPQSSSIRGSRFPMRELRVQSKGKPIRVLYCFDPRRQAVVILGGHKTDSRFYDRNVPRAERLYQSYLDESTGEAMEKMAEKRKTRAHRWGDIRRKNLTEAQATRVRELVRARLVELTLRDLREQAGKTQNDLAALTEMTQAELSRFERRDDRKLSTLRKYVEALGGELEVVATFGRRRVKLVGV